ncbi:MAG: hypothetical protein PUJ85_06420 [bacterium]|nr:hypothetical protein [bacterium]
MEKFEIGKVYLRKSGCGIGADHCSYCDYYLITRKNEKSIWWKKISITTELYSRDTNEKADFKKFEKAVEKRSKLNIYKENEEYFIDTHESGYKDYIFVKYAKEVK